MELLMQKYSYRSGEDLLNHKPTIRREIEGILLGQGMTILSLFGDEYSDVIRQSFTAREWQSNLMVVDGSGQISDVMDFRKDNVGIKLGTPSNSSPTDMIEFQTARNDPSTEIDIGIYIVTMAETQNALLKSSGKPWVGTTMEATVKNFNQIGRQMHVPVCVLGLDLYESPVKSIDIDKTAPSIIKELILAYLESVYNTQILKNVRVKGKHAVMEFDGIAKLDGKDTILAVELCGGKGNFPSRLNSDYLFGFADTVREYGEMSGREICLRFVLLGNFRNSFVEEYFGMGGTATVACEGIEVQYDLRSFESFDMFLANKRAALAGG